MTLDKQALDRYITGNYGEDQFREDRDDESPELDQVSILIPGALYYWIKQSVWFTNAKFHDEASAAERFLVEELEHARVRRVGFGEQWLIVCEQWQEADVRALLVKVAEGAVLRGDGGVRAAAKRFLA